MSGDLPRWEDADENEYERKLVNYREGYTEIVDRLMALHGLTLVEAERVASELTTEEER